MRRHFVLALIVVLVAGTAVAQDDEDPFLYWHDYKPPDPSKTLLLAERADVARVKAARTGSVLSGYDLTRHQHATVADGLIEAPAVYVERRRLWLQSPVLRGLSGPRVMLMIDDMLADGMLWPDAPYEDMAYIDPQATGRVEVLRGSASSIYGSGAMGGLVSAETVLRQDFRTDFDFSSSMLGRIDTASREQFVSMALESNATDFLGSIGVLSFGDIKNHDAGGGLGERKGNAYRRQDYTFSFNVPVRGRLAVDAIAQVHRINRADGADVLYDRVRIHESGRDLYRLRAKAMELGAVLNWIELSGGAYTRYRHRSLEAEGADSPFIDRERTISGQGRAAVSLRFGRFLETLWGADGVLDRYEGKRDGPGSTPPPLPEDSRADRLGLWTELRFSPLSWLHIVPAGRVEWLWAGARREIAGMGARSIAYYTHEEAWSASGVFDVGERFHLFGRIENAFRFPGMVELAGLETAQGPLYVPATDIVSVSYTHLTLPTN